MQDLYSFDNSEQAAQETYKLISQTYQTFLETIGVDFLKGLFQFKSIRAKVSDSEVTCVCVCNHTTL